MSRPSPRSDLAMRWAMGTFKDRNRTIYTLLIIGVLLWPSIADVTTGGSGNHLVSTAADAGVYVLLAIGLNVVVGFAGLLDLGYAAFFAIGAYTYGLLASGQLSGSPLHHEFHLPFWVLILVAMFVAAAFGAILGAPTLRLRGDYLAIVTLGFGEIVPRVFRFLGAGSPIGNWTGGVNGISAIDPPHLPAFISGPWFGTPIQVVSPFDFSDSNWAPMDYYWLIILLVAICIVLVTNLPDYAVAFSNLVGLGFLNQSGPGWVGLHDEVQRLNYIVFGLILVVVMLIRPQGLFPSRIREQELEKGTAEEAVFDVREASD